MNPEDIKKKLEELAEREKKDAAEKRILEEALKKAEEESKKKAEDEAKKMDGYLGQLRELEELHAKALQKTGEYEKRIRESYLRQHYLETEIENLRKKLNGPPSTTPHRQRTSAKAASSSPRKVTTYELQHAISRIQSTSKPPLKMKFSVKQMKPILEENFEENLEDEDELVGELKLGPKYQKEVEESQRRKAEIRAIAPVANYERIGNLERCSRCHYVPKPGKNETFNLKRHIEEKKCEQKSNEYCWVKRQKMKERMVGNEENGEDGEKKENKKKAGHPKKQENEEGGKKVESKSSGTSGAKRGKSEEGGGGVDPKKMKKVLKNLEIQGTPKLLAGNLPSNRELRSANREMAKMFEEEKRMEALESIRKATEQRKQKGRSNIQWNNAKADLEQINRLEKERKLVEEGYKLTRREMEGELIKLKKAGDNLDGNRVGNEGDLDKFFKTPIRNAPSNPLPENLMEMEPLVIEPRKKPIVTMRARPGGYIWKQGQEESDKEEDRLIIDEGEDEEMDEEEEEEVPKKAKGKKNAYSGPCFENGYSPYDPNWSSDEDDGEGGQIEVA